jgi:hypothetical protein
MPPLFDVTLEHPDAHDLDDRVELACAWREATDESLEAYEAWRAAEAEDKPERFAVYRAAIDREDAAASALARCATAAA